MSKARDLANAGTALTTVSATELGYLDGVTSAVQTQLNAKQATVSGVNDTEIGYLDGVTSAIQTQLNGKVASVSGTSGRVTSSGGTTPVVDLATSGVTAGSYGTASAIPAITVDTYGRVTSATTNAFTSGGWTQISSASFSGQTAINFNSLSGYKFYRAVINGISSPASNTLRLRFNNDSTTGRYRNMYYASGGTTATYTNESNDNHIVFSGSFSSNPSFGNNCVINVFNPNNSGAITTTMSGHLSNNQFYGNYSYTSGPVSSMNFFTSSTAWDGGTITLFGGN